MLVISYVIRAAELLFGILFAEVVSVSGRACSQRVAPGDLRLTEKIHHGGTEDTENGARWGFSRDHSVKSETRASGESENEKKTVLISITPP